MCIRNPVSAAANTLSSTTSPSMTSTATQAATPKAVTTPTVPATPSAWSRARKARATKVIQPTAAHPGERPGVAVGHDEGGRDRRADRRGSGR